MGLERHLLLHMHVYGALLLPALAFSSSSRRFCLLARRL
jgi:hypothetical protein